MTGEIQGIVGGNRDTAEGAISVTHFLKSVQRKTAGAASAAVFALEIEPDQCLRIVIGQGLEEKSICDGENRGVSANSQGESNNRGQAESHVPQNHPQAITNIPPKIAEASNHCPFVPWLRHTMFRRIIKPSRVKMLIQPRS